MAVYKKADDWNGSTTISARGGGTLTHLNHDSKLTFDEVVALVKQLDGLPGFGDGGGWSVTKPAGIPAKIWDLANAMRKPATSIVVEKGVHQRNTKPHIRIKLSLGAASYHVELSAAAAGGTGGTFNWKTVGVTFVTATAHTMQTWPATYTQSLPGSSPSVARRGSISVGTLPPAPVTPAVTTGAT